MEGRRMKNLSGFRCAPENTDIGYATISIGSQFTVELAIREGPNPVEVCNDK